MKRTKVLLILILILGLCVNLSACKSSRVHRKSERPRKPDRQTEEKIEMPEDEEDARQSISDDQQSEDEEMQEDAENVSDDQIEIENDEDKSETKTSAANQLSNEELNQAFVLGATQGSSRSDYVADREVWNDFIVDEEKAIAQRAVGGVHIPEILFDSADAQNANATIEEIISDMKQSYTNYQQSKDMETAKDILGMEANFSVYQNQDFLSVHMTVTDFTAGFFAKHNIFNFSLPDGNFISDAELLSYFDIAETDILGYMENAIVDDYERLSDAYYDSSNCLGNMNFLAGMALQDLWEHYADTDHLVFIDEIGQPQFLYSQYTMAGAGVYSNTLPLLKSGENIKQQYSAEYIRMAKELGIDLDDQTIQGIMIYLGNGYDKASIEDVLTKLYPWQIAYLDYREPKMLFNIKENEKDYSINLAGQEFYLLIPKMKNASVSLQELALDEAGELKKVDNYYLEGMAASGPVLICQNESEIAPNAEITIQYRNQKTQFSPSVSLKDGSIILPAEIYNGQDLMDWDGLKQADFFSWYLRDNLFELKGLKLSEDN